MAAILQARSGLTVVVGLGCLLAHTPAQADAIDGNWCLIDGKRMSINGPAIVTPGGTETTGIYDRHAFSYTVPAADAGAGNIIAMRLISDNVLHLSMEAQPIEVWNRCAPAVSHLLSSQAANLG